MKKHLILAVFALSSSAAIATDVAVQQDVFGQPLKITASGSRFAGAIFSLTYRGKEYINTSDHGRELQSASSFDGFGECFNPTEAGSSADSSKQTSSSALISAYGSGGVLHTSTNMAFWLLPGQAYGKNCGSTSYTSAQNTTVLSGHVLSKTVSIGYQGIPNLIRYQVSFGVAEAHKSAVFEVVTGYMPPDFSEFLTYDPVSRTLNRVSDGPGEQPRPVILATADGRNAMGVISLDLPQAKYPNIGYGRFRFPDTTKWNCVFREGSIAAGATQNYECFIAVGTVNEVMVAENSLLASTTKPAPLFRFYNGRDHFITASFNEAASAGYRFEGTAFHVYPTAIDGGMISLYRCYTTTGDHFVSKSQSCEGTRYEGRYGYVSQYARPGFQPLYRLFNPLVGDHLITTNAQEGLDNGYHMEETLGYVN